MSSDIPAVSVVVPKIVITEPSLPVEDASGRVPCSAITATTSAEPPATTPATEPPATTPATEPPATTPATEPPQPSGRAEERAVPLNTSFTASEGFVPVEDCTEVRVEVHDGRLPTTDPGVSEDEVTGDGLSRRAFRDRVLDCFRCCAFLIQPWKLSFCFQVLLLAVSIIAVVMGGWYMDKCPLGTAIPFFVFMMGIAGFMVILCRLIILVKTTSGRDRNNFRVLSTIAICGNVAIALLFCTEIVSFMRLSPSFRPGDSNYCDEIFYKNTHWMNCCGLFFIFVMAAIHTPKMCRPTAP